MGVFDEMNGSAGIQSNADSMIVISSNRKMGTNPILSCLPKDAEQKEFEISLNPKLMWEYVGKPGEANRTKLQTTILVTLKKLDKKDGVNVGDIKNGVRSVDDSWSPEHVQMEIGRLHENDEILKIKRGVYKMAPI